MIIIKTAGGLGNQMFQYAFARELQCIGKEVKVDCSYYDSIPKGDTSRIDAYSLLGREVERATREEVDYFLKKNDALIYKAIRKLGGKDICLPVYYERNNRYDSRLLKRNSGLYIGYWQSEKYFVNVKKQIKQEYKALFSKLDKKDQEIFERIKACENSVSIHIRGGDYFNAQNINRFGGICDKQYYQVALAFCNRQLGKCHFFIFTNDYQYTQKVLPNNEEYEIVNNSEEDGHKDIFLMSQCKHNIIANSSFSWWGAWLNENKEKLVIAPEKWDQAGEMRNIYCRDWTIVK